MLKKGLLGGLSLSLLLLGMQPSAYAQISGHSTQNSTQSSAPSNTQSVTDTTFDATPLPAPLSESAAELTNLEAAEGIPAQTAAIEEPVELAQARRRTRNAVGRRGNDFIGVGADFGYADDVSFAVISKLSFNEKFAIRPSVLIGDDSSVLVPVTYEFNQFATEFNDFQVRPYAGVGASYSDSDDDEDLNLLLSAGADIPLSQRFTINAQANLGVFNDTDFGVTVGVGYNFGRVFR